MQNDKKGNYQALEVVEAILRNPQDVFARGLSAIQEQAIIMILGDVKIPKKITNDHAKQHLKFAEFRNYVIDNDIITTDKLFFDITDDLIEAYNYIQYRSFIKYVDIAYTVIIENIKFNELQDELDYANELDEILYISEEDVFDTLEEYLEGELEDYYYTF